MLSPEKAKPELTAIYNVYRNAALNKNYYGKMLAKYQSRNTCLEILIALGAASSGVSALALWKTGWLGQLTWTTIAAVSAILAVAKPFLQLNNKVERYSKLFTGHLDNYQILTALVTKIRRKECLTEDMIEQFESAEQRYFDLSRDDDPVPNKKLHAECEQSVRVSIPIEVLWYPSDRPSSAAVIESPDDTCTESKP